MPPNNLPPARLARIRLVVTDFDGIWTDGSIFVTDQGHEYKCFSAHDGMGITLGREAGLKFAILSARRTREVLLRAIRLGVHHVEQGCAGKEAGLARISLCLDIPLAETLYMGDDLADLPAMAAAGLAVTVPQAPPEVQGAAAWVTTRPGGRGALREVVEAVLRASGRWEQVMARFHPPAGPERESLP